MSIQEFHQAFKIGLDKVDSLNYPDFLPEEIDFLLNQSQDRFIRQRYGKNNAKKESFEETQKRKEDLKTVVKTAHLNPQPPSVDNISADSRFYILPIDHRYIVQEQANISYLDCHGDTITKKVLVRPIQHDDYDKIQYDPFNRANDVKVLRLMAEGMVEIVSSPGYTLGEYFLRYIKAPQRMSFSGNITSELPEDVHQDLVNDAVNIALEDIESRRSQTFNKIQNTQE